MRDLLVLRKLSARRREAALRGCDSVTNSDWREGFVVFRVEKNSGLRK